MSARVEVQAVIATYRRPDSLRALLDSLAAERPRLAGVIVVDNGRDEETARVVAGSPVPTRRIVPDRNLGCGGGVAFGLREALAVATTTHVWVLDDDVEVVSGALPRLVDALAAANAGAAVPLMVDSAGLLGWFPGPLPPAVWSAIRAPGATPASVRAVCGDTLQPWVWAPWPALLVTRLAVEQVGYPRCDYWFQGEDLEWTLRISERLPGVLVPGAVCRHLLPSAGDQRREHRKRVLMLQNNFHTARLCHGARLRRHAAGNVWRTLCRAHFAPAAGWDIALAWWRGGVCGHPAGTPEGDGLRRAWKGRL